MPVLFRSCWGFGSLIIATSLAQGCWLEADSPWNRLATLPLGSATDPRCVPRTTPALPKEDHVHCVFPPQADAAGIDFADVDASVCVDEYGKPTAVMIHDHLGSGFDLATRKCLGLFRFTPATNAKGQWAAGVSPHVLVKFRR